MLKRIRKSLKNKKGFTLVELIVVIAILGILAGIAVPRLTGFQETARERTDITNAKTIANAVAILRADEEIAQDEYILTGDSPSDDLADIFHTLNDEWPTPSSAVATAGDNDTFVVNIDANDVVTVVTNTAANDGTEVAIYPNPADGFND